MNISASQVSRIVSNYGRMLVTFFMGIWLVRVLLEMGQEVYAVVALLGAAMGIAGIMKEMVRGTMVPAIGLALHREEGAAFQETYSAAWILSFVAALVSVAIISSFYLFFDYLEIPDSIRSSAALYLFTRIPSTFAAILLAPATNLMPVTGRMVANNMWQALERVGDVMAAVIVAAYWYADSPADQLARYAMYSVLPLLAVEIGWAAHGVLGDRKYYSGLRKPSAGVMKAIVSNIGWNSFYVISMNLYLRLDTILTNLFFGVSGTLVFSLAGQLLSYMRLLTIGLVQGLDAVVARMVSAEGEQVRARRLLANTDRMQALITFSSAAYLAINVVPLLHLWVGDKFHGDEHMLDRTALTAMVMLPGIISRSISEGWMRFLSGSGEVRKYGLKLFAGAILNPFLVILLVHVLPGDIAYLAAAVAFSLLLFVVHMLVLPGVIAKHIGTTKREIVRPFLFPLALTATALLGSIALNAFFSLEGIARLAVDGAVFAALFAVPVLKGLLKSV